MSATRIAVITLLVGSLGCNVLPTSESTTLAVGHRLTIQPPNVGSVEYLSPPSVSSGAVVFDSMVSAVLPIPAGAAEDQWFYFTAVAPGVATIRIRHSPQDSGFVEVVEVP
ncbi:MAG: hypothetical protein ACREL4_07960 [Gemmatimonadales bacterium]